MGNPGGGKPGRRESLEEINSGGRGTLGKGKPWRREGSPGYGKDARDGPTKSTVMSSKETLEKDKIPIV